MEWILALFAFLAGVCNGLMDTVEFHPHYFFFEKIYDWDHRVYFWITGLGDKRKNFPWFLRDGWHALKTAMLVFLAGAVFAGAGKLTDFFIFIAAWGAGFNGIFEGLRGTQKWHERKLKVNLNA